MMLKEKKTFVTIVLDCSGSMQAIKNEIVSGLNEQVDIIQQHALKGGETLVSLITFTTEGWDNIQIKELFFNKPASLLKHIEKHEYDPVGGTPMYDGVGHALDRLSDLDDGGEDTAFLVLVVSDGYENASKKYSAKDIAERVRALTKTGRWTFSYLGANQDLSVVQEQTGFTGVSYRSTRAGTKNLFLGVSEANTQYFSLRESGATMDAGYSETVASAMDEENSSSAGK